MNVLYTCTQGCRGFFASGGTRMKCHQHNEQFQQKEGLEPGAPTFNFIDVDGNVHYPNQDERAAEMGDVEHLRNRYQEVVGKPADKRFSARTLLEEIQEAAPQPALDTTED